MKGDMVPIPTKIQITILDISDWTRISVNIQKKKCL